MERGGWFSVFAPEGPSSVAQGGSPVYHARMRFRAPLINDKSPGLGPGLSGVLGRGHITCRGRRSGPAGTGRRRGGSHTGR